MSRNEETSRWYREPWFWMVAGPLILAIISSVIGAYIAIVGADDRVKDDYYTEGKTINHRFEADKLALSLGVKAAVRFDIVSGEVLVELSGLSYFPHQLELLLSHPLRAQQDQILLLKQVDASRYRADIPQLLLGRWYLQLRPAEVPEPEKWRLVGEIDLRKSAGLALSPEVQ